jgi:hypothetical protein
MTPAPDAGLDGMGRAPGKQLAASFSDAAVPELLIAAVLGLGSSAVLSQRPHAWAPPPAPPASLPSARSWA